MKTITIEYFAVLREHSGVADEALATNAATPAELFAELSERYGFPELASIKVAINDEFGDWSAALNDGDTVVFIPPVAGG
jgi:molybdopterin converting factor subunit 1